MRLNLLSKVSSRRYFSAVFQEILNSLAISAVVMTLSFLAKFRIFSFVLCDFICDFLFSYLFLYLCINIYLNISVYLENFKYGIKLLFFMKQDKSDRKKKFPTGCRANFLETSKKKNLVSIRCT